MLSLPIDAPHEAVCARLYALGTAGRAIDLDALPKRYARSAFVDALGYGWPTPKGAVTT